MTEFEQISAWAEISPALLPDAPFHARYEQIYPVYAGLYAKLKADMDIMNTLTAPAIPGG